MCVAVELARSVQPFRGSEADSSVFRTRRPREPALDGACLPVGDLRACHRLLEFSVKEELVVIRPVGVSVVVRERLLVGNGEAPVVDHLDLRGVRGVRQNVVDG